MRVSPLYGNPLCISPLLGYPSNGYPPFVFSPLLAKRWNLSLCRRMCESGPRYPWGEREENTTNVEFSILGLSSDTNTRRNAGFSDLRNPAKSGQTRQPGYQLRLKSRSAGVLTVGLIDSWHRKTSFRRRYRHLRVSRNCGKTEPAQRCAARNVLRE